MNALETAFTKMKAKVKVTKGNPEKRRALTTGYTVDVKDGEFQFNLGFTDATVQIQDVDLKDRHVLVNVRRSEPLRGGGVGFINEKWLCGHDERDWFVASAKGISIAEAKEELKPAEVKIADAKVSRKKRNKRNNGARIRQGEWFFIPEPGMEVPEGAIIHKNEPISRGRGSKNHYVQEVYRTGGRTVMTKGGRILEEADYKKLPTKDQKGWTPRVADASVYGRGTVRHVDHNTIFLDCWHKILMNREESRGTTLMFLD